MSGTSTLRGVRCGSCGDRHANVNEVKACYAEAGAFSHRPQPAAEQESPKALAWLGATSVAEHRGVSYTLGSGLVSSRQAEWIIDIILDREVSEEIATSTKLRLGQGLASFAAKNFITTYRDYARRPKAEETGPIDAPGSAPMTDGMYRDPGNGDVFKVQHAKANGSGRLYAKMAEVTGEAKYSADGKALLRPAEVTFRYVSGLLALIHPEWRMSREEEIEWGQLYGRCTAPRCNLALTDETSIAFAMGPVCRKKWGVG